MNEDERWYPGADVEYDGHRIVAFNMAAPRVPLDWSLAAAEKRWQVDSPGDGWTLLVTDDQGVNMWCRLP